MLSVFTAGITPRVPAFFWGMMTNADIPSDDVNTGGADGVTPAAGIVSRVSEQH